MQIIREITQFKLQTKGQSATFLLTDMQSALVRQDNLIIKLNLRSRTQTQEFTLPRINYKYIGQPCLVIDDTYYEIRSSESILVFDINQQLYEERQLDVSSHTPQWPLQHHINTASVIFIIDNINILYGFDVQSECYFKLFDWSAYLNNGLYQIQQMFVFSRRQLAFVVYDSLLQKRLFYLLDLTLSVKIPLEVQSAPYLSQLLQATTQENISNFGLSQIFKLDGDVLLTCDDVDSQIKIIGHRYQTSLRKNVFQCEQGTTFKQQCLSFKNCFCGFTTSIGQFHLLAANQFQQIDQLIKSPIDYQISDNGITQADLLVNQKQTSVNLVEAIIQKLDKLRHSEQLSINTLKKLIKDALELAGNDDNTQPLRQNNDKVEAQQNNVSNQEIITNNEQQLLTVQNKLLWTVAQNHMEILEQNIRLYEQKIKRKLTIQEKIEFNCGNFKRLAILQQNNIYRKDVIK